MRSLCVLALFPFLLLSGCDRAGPGPASPGRFRVALILPGSENDKGWNQMAREGLDLIRAQLGADTRMISNVSASEFASQIKYFAEEGYDVVICHGGEFEKPVAAAARTYPNTRFIVGGCSNEVAGATAVEFLTRDVSALVGVVAAKVTRTRTVAFVGAMELPSLQACYDGMRDGLTGSDVKLIPPQWTNSWDSPTQAKEKTEAAIAAGADVVYQNVDAAAKGVFEAVQAANKPGRPAYAFGCNRNQNDQAVDVILGSVVLDVPRAYLDLTRAAKEKSLIPGMRKLGLKEGYVDLVLNEKHPGVTADVRAAVDEKRRQLRGK